MVLVRSAWVWISVLWFSRAVLSWSLRFCSRVWVSSSAFAEPLVLLPECDSHEVYGFVAGVFEVAVGDVYVAVAAREFAVGDDLMFPLSVWVL